MQRVGGGLHFHFIYSTSVVFYHLTYLVYLIVVHERMTLLPDKLYKAPFFALALWLRTDRQEYPARPVLHAPKLAISIIMWLCLTRTGNYRIQELDWLKSILKAV